MGLVGNGLPIWGACGRVRLRTWRLHGRRQDAHLYLASASSRCCSAYKLSVRIQARGIQIENGRPAGDPCETANLVAEGFCGTIAEVSMCDIMKCRSTGSQHDWHIYCYLIS